MNTTHMMKCGHTAQGRCDGKPVCVICAPDPEAFIVADPPDLTNRQAKCGGCDRVVPSSFNLPFFEYLGPGSHRANEMCKCGFFLVGHIRAPEKTCDDFRPVGPYEFDKYYCGCWN